MQPHLKRCLVEMQVKSVTNVDLPARGIAVTLANDAACTPVTVPAVTESFVK